MRPTFYQRKAKLQTRPKTLRDINGSIGGHEVDSAILVGNICGCSSMCACLPLHVKQYMLCPAALLSFWITCKTEINTLKPFVVWYVQLSQSMVPDVKKRAQAANKQIMPLIMDIGSRFQ